MKVITKPTVTVIAATQFFGHPVYKIPADGTDAEKLGSFAAKGCYDSFGEKGRSNVENQRAVLGNAHGSVIEHCYVTVFVEGITRALSLEMNRHRHFNISQRSTRYTLEDDAAIVLEPYYSNIFERYQFWYDDDTEALGGEFGWRSRNPDNYDFREAQLLTDHLDQSQKAISAYKEEVERLVSINPSNLTGFDLRKWARGKARNILPHSLETRATYTANYRAWRWFIQLRSEKHAEAEIRRLAYEVYQAIKGLAPVYFEDIHEGDIVNGIPELIPTQRKI